MFNYKQTFNYRYFVGSGAVLTDTTKSTADLVPLQVGLFDAKTFKALPSVVDAKQVPEILIALGSPNAENKVSWTNVTESFKTTPINARRLISYRKSLPVKALNHKVAVGWDGVNDCKNLSINCGETKTLALQIEGNPATRFFGAKPLTARYIYTAPCCPDDNPSATADVEKMVDFFVNSINSDKFINPFIRADKIVDYGTPPSPDTLDYESFTLTIPDSGQIQDLAKIQALYPNAYSVTRTSRDGIYSTYTLIQLTSETNPSPFATSATVTIPNCTTCPSGYTLVPAYDKFKIEVGDIGLDNSSGLESSIGSDAISVTKISGDMLKGTYVLLATEGELSAEDVYNAIINAEAGIGSVVTSLGQTEPYCTLTSATTVPWVAGQAYFREGRDICLTLGADVCPDPSGVAQLADIITYYEGSDLLDPESIAEDEDGKCAYSYTATQYSTNLLKEDECYTGVATFATPPAYNGFTWDLCPCADSTESDITNIGIVLTGAYVDTKFGDCSFKYADFVELDLPRIIVTQGNALDELGKCADAWEITQLQRPQYPTGTGENVKRNYIQATQLQHQLWSDDPRWREILGFNYDFIDRAKSYKTFYLEYELTEKAATALSRASDRKATVSIVFPEDVDTTTFENQLEGWITSVRPDLVDADLKDNIYR